MAEVKTHFEMSENNQWAVIKTEMHLIHIWLK